MPLAVLAANVDRAAQHRDQSLRDDEAESRPAESPRRRCIGLRKRLEKPVELLGGHAGAGVDDLESNDASRVGHVARTDSYRHFALLRELDRVADQVREHLTEAQRIAAKVQNHRVLGKRDVQILETVVPRRTRLGNHLPRCEDAPAEIRIDRLTCSDADADVASTVKPFGSIARDTVCVQDIEPVELSLGVGITHGRDRIQVLLQQHAVVVERQIEDSLFARAAGMHIAAPS